MRALVVTVSTRAARGAYDDQTGPLIVEELRARGFDVEGPRVVADGPAVGVLLREAVAGAYDVVVTTGGTGISPTDRTPDQTRILLDREVPGLAEAIRAYGVAQGVPSAALSRGVAGVSGLTLVVNLPGSRGGVRDGLAVLGPVLVHAVEQIHGSDHRGDHPGDPRGDRAGDHDRSGGAS